MDGGWSILPFQLGPVVFLLPQTFSTVTQEKRVAVQALLVTDESGEDPKYH